VNQHIPSESGTSTGNVIDNDGHIWHEIVMCPECDAQTISVHDWNDRARMANWIGLICPGCGMSLNAQNVLVDWQLKED